MATIEFVLPDIGEGLAEVELVRWLVSENDRVAENDPVAEVESDKAIVTMPAPASGRVARLCAAVGERIKVGELLMVVEGESTAQRVDTEAPPSAGVSAEPRTDVPPVGAPPVAGPAAEARPAPAAARSVAAAPSVRKRAGELGVDLESVTGTGPRNRITLEDVEQAAQGRTPTAPVTAPAAPQSQSRPQKDRREPPVAGAEVDGETELVPFRGVRRRIAEAMEHSARTIPHVCGFHEFDAAELVRLRGALKGRAEASGLRLTYLPFIIRAVALALKKHPYLNASLDDEAQVIRLKKVYNIGIATAAADGLTVPVIRRADSLGLLQIAQEAERLVSAARDRTLTPAEVQEGTFTITNVGASRGWLNTSLIRHPEVAILGAGRIEDRAVVRDGQVVVRPILPLALTFDHRVIDGDQALAFMLALRGLLESPEGLLLAEPGVSQ